MFNKLETLERGEKIGPALEMELAVQRIENIRRVIDELFRIMGTEDEKQEEDMVAFCDPKSASYYLGQFLTSTQNMLK